MRDLRVLDRRSPHCGLSLLGSSVLALVVFHVAVKADEVRTWADRSGRYTIAATLLEFVDGNVRLRRASDGKEIEVPLESLSDGDQSYVWKDDRDSIVVTGVGLDPDAALKNAFSRAIEQTVGVLVEADSIVKNEELVRDIVRTYSRGKVRTFQVLRRWEEGGLQYAMVRAQIAVGEVAKRLEEKHVAMRPIDGGRISLQLWHDAKADQDAAALLTDSLTSYSPEQFIRVELTGQYEVIERGGGVAKIRVPVRLVSDMQRWEAFRTNLRGLLREIAFKQYPVPAFQCGRTSWSDPGYCLSYHLPGFEAAAKYEEQEAKEAGVWLLVFRKIEPVSHDKVATSWEAFRVPAAASVFLGKLLECKWDLLVEIRTAAGTKVADTRIPLTARRMFPSAAYDRPLTSAGYVEWGSNPRYPCYLLSPLVRTDGGSDMLIAASIDLANVELTVDVQDLEDGMKVVASLQRAGSSSE